eukprot:GHVR01037659.1.p1 GENE.GHVR01037659.1~~GHVR01037659.1.p1  ORF type:complete len:192 (+),score=50.83 GHVR01037659.1:102-677(+)
MYEDKSRKKRSVSPLIIGGILALLFIIIGAVCYFFFFSSDDSTKTSTKVIHSQSTISGGGTVKDICTDTYSQIKWKPGSKDEPKHLSDNEIKANSMKFVEKSFSENTCKQEDDSKDNLLNCSLMQCTDSKYDTDKVTPPVEFYSDDSLKIFSFVQSHGNVKIQSGDGYGISNAIFKIYSEKGKNNKQNIYI